MPNVLTEEQIAKVAFDLLKLLADVAGDRLTKPKAQEARALVDKLLAEQYRRGFMKGYDKAISED